MEVNRSYRRFREDPASVDVAELEAAERSLREVRGRVASVPAPAIAADLRRAVLRALDGQIDFAGEVALLAAYLPVAAEVEADLGEATSRLRRDVNACEVGAGPERGVRRVRDPHRGARGPAARGRPTGLVRRSARRGGGPRRGARGAARRRWPTVSEAAQVTSINRSVDRFAAAATGSQVAEARRQAVLVYGRRLRELARLQLLADRERQELEAAGA